MKKALALILTVAMLLSCVAMSVAAVREFSVVTETTSAKYWQYDADSAYFYPEANGSYYSMDIRLDQADSGLTAWGGNSISFSASGIGVGNNNVAYTLEVGTWYNVEWTTVDGGTDIKVNGEYIGTSTTQMKDRLIGGMNLVSIDNIDCDNFSEDFENGGWNSGKGDSLGIWVEEESSTTTVVNKNVSKVVEENTYWQYDADSAYFYPEANGSYYSMDIRLDSADSALTAWGGNSISFSASGIGVGNNNVPYTLEVGTWYNVEWTTVDGGTDIKVNGEYIGTSTTQMKDRLIGGMNLVSLDNIDCDNFSEDFEDGAWNSGKGDSLGVICTEETATVKAEYDLGTYYWQYDPDSAYFYPETFGSYVEMDLCLDSADSALTAWGGNSISFSTTGIGVGNNNLAYTFVPGTWYHVKWVVNNGATDIYVDDTFVGTCSTEMKDRPIGGMNLVSFDNLECDNYSEDFEDGAWNSGKGDSLGVIMEYDFGIVPEETIMDKIAATTPAGEAILLESDANSAYMLGYGNDIGKNYAISFDLALIPNDQETPNSNEGSKFELWRTSNGSIKRFTIGTAFAGRDDDTKEYAYIEGMEAGWGEATWNNFHNVIIVFDGNNAELYVDRCLAWSGPAANQFDGVEFIGMLINASAIVDNYTVYDLDGNVIDDSFPIDGNWSGDSYMDPVRVNLDTENFCADNCHVYGSIERTTKETCTNTGVDTVWCAICGEAKSETEIAMLPHQYNKFDNTRVVDGKYYTDCKNCGTRLYSAIPAEDSYTGSIIAYFDMSDAMFGELNNGETEAINSGWFGDQFRYEDGKAILDADSYLANYSEFSFAGHFQQAVSSKGWSYNFRMTYNGTWIGDNNWDGNDCAMYWWLRGVSLELGYNAVDEQWYIGPSGNPGAVTIEKATADFKFQEGLTYNIKFGLMFDDDEEYAEITIYVNDELVLIHSVDETGADIYYDCDFGTDVIDTIYCRNFGFAYEMDDLVIGSYDFAWNKVVGDVDNDGTLTAADALMMRRYLAKVIGDADVNLDLMDVNGDGVINAKDQLTLRKALAA